MREVVFGVALDQGFDEGSFANAWRTNDANDNGRGLLGQAVDEGDM